MVKNYIVASVLLGSMLAGHAHAVTAPHATLRKLQQNNYGVEYADEYPSVDVVYGAVEGPSEGLGTGLAPIDVVTGKRKLLNDEAEIIGEEASASEFSAADFSGELEMSPVYEDVYPTLPVDEDSYSLDTYTVHEVQEEDVSEDVSDAAFSEEEFSRIQYIPDFYDHDDSYYQDIYTYVPIDDYHHEDDDDDDDYYQDIYTYVPIDDYHHEEDDDDNDWFGGWDDDSDDDYHHESDDDDSFGSWWDDDDDDDHHESDDYYQEDAPPFYLPTHPPAAPVCCYAYSLSCISACAGVSEHKYCEENPTHPLCIGDSGDTYYGRRLLLQDTLPTLNSL